MTEFQYFGNEENYDHTIALNLGKLHNNAMEVSLLLILKSDIHVF